MSVSALFGVSSVNATSVISKMCPSSKGQLACLGQVRNDDSGKPLVTTAPSGLSPVAFHSVYRIGTTAPVATTIGIVTAYDNPRITSDINTFSSAFGLPGLPTCTKASQIGCLLKVDQAGGTHYPSYNAGWALETSLDVETIHGMCQDCRIVLVEATTASLTNLLAAVDRAVSLGARIVSNSYGGSESASELSADSHFDHAGVSFVASSGDSGYGTSYPAASRFVTAVGGTTLRVAVDGSRASETAWSGAGSGCSRYEPKPSWQTDTGCTRRSIADVAAAADPATGAAIYSSNIYSGRSGWFVLGGTSLAAPLVAGMMAVSSPVSATASGLYARVTTRNVFDITSGNNGSCAASKAYLCTARPGYDGPTGLGAPAAANWL